MEPDPPRVTTAPAPGGTGPEAVAHWIWGGRALSPEAAKGRVYLFQGLIKMQDGKNPDSGKRNNDNQEDRFLFVKQGLFPFPAGARDLFLVFRAQALDTAGDLAALLAGSRSAWRGHGNSVSGFQLDYDCPTGKLRGYARFLAGLKRGLGPGTALSVTGLTDWARNGSPEDLRLLAASVDEVVFQLYEGRERVSELRPALTRLESLGLPYKAGLLSTDTSGIAILSRSADFPHCRGMVLFPVPGA
ncbi:MAG: DUF3142 domain-containing protein [Fibrobacteres bacterium]|nr:DUF3142 domain-containing protein [Fibrobacterota bacterium]